MWALLDYGFRVVISPRFGDIFRGNSLKAGLLTVVLAREDRAAAVGRHRGRPERREVTVDLVERQVRWSGEVHDFELDDYTRWRLLEGLDDIGLTLRHTDAVEAYEPTPQALVAHRSRPETPGRSRENSRDTRRDYVVVGARIVLACRRNDHHEPSRSRPGGHVPNKAQFVELLAERLDGDKKKRAARRSTQ